MESSLAQRLLESFRAQDHDLPWRRNRTPYRVLVAEFMLQQTRSETVIPYY
ncbi:MAG: A/G-specific adenine glycosylase, partial [Anaerolineae bacterium]|nr:A/G-specific adenine glycosylase [Anaerolineae bacterium]